MRVFCIAQPGDGELKQMKSDLMAFLKRFRIDAEPHIVDLGRDDDITEFTYEKTLRLQQRQELLMEMRLQSETDIFSLKPLNDNPQPTQPKPKRKP